jgi:hypothetical protein
MKYLVMADAIEFNPTAPPEEAAGVIERRVIPSLEMLAQWEDEGKVTGGGFAGRRAMAFIVEAESNEVAKLLASLPYWSIIRWRLSPFNPSGRRPTWCGNNSKRLSLLPIHKIT